MLYAWCNKVVDGWFSIQGQIYQSKSTKLMQAGWYYCIEHEFLSYSKYMSYCTAVDFKFHFKHCLL